MNSLAHDTANGPRQRHEQGSLCEATVRQTQLLAQWGARLVAQERLRYVQLLPLARRVIDEAASAPILNWSVPVTGRSLLAHAGSGAGHDADVFIEGLTTARVLIWALHDAPHAVERLPSLVLAALFQDVGRLLPPADRKRGKEFCEKRTALLARQHPAIGAALLGTILGTPVEWTLLVGQHHERLDGCGFPQGLAAGEIVSEGAILATATRFARLCLEIDSVERPDDRAASLPALAAQVLLAEAQWGFWPVDFATRLSERVAMKEEKVAEASMVPPGQQETLPPTPDEFQRDPPDHRERTRQLHGREQGPPGLHAAGRRLADAGWYERKMLIDRESR